LGRYNKNAPQCEEYYFGLIVSGFQTREDAEACIRNYNTPEAQAERVAYWREDRERRRQQGLPTSIEEL